MNVTSAAKLQIIILKVYVRVVKKFTEKQGIPFKVWHERQGIPFKAWHILVLKRVDFTFE